MVPSPSKIKELSKNFETALKANYGNKNDVSEEPATKSLNRTDSPSKRLSPNEFLGRLARHFPLAVDLELKLELNLTPLVLVRVL